MYYCCEYDIRLCAIAKDKEMREEKINTMTLSYKTYEKQDFTEMLKVIPPERLSKFLTIMTVSGGNTDFTIHDLSLIDSSFVLLCW